MWIGITFIGWTLLALGYAPIAALLTWMAHKHGVRTGAFIGTAIVTSIPFVAAIAEAAYVEYNWRALCATAKTEVKRQVVVEGFYDDGFRDTGWKVLHGGKDGFRFVEWKDAQGRIWRTEGFTEPELRTLQIDKPSARYHWHFAQFASPVSHLLSMRDDKVTDTQTGEVIARQILGYRDPSLVDRLWRQWFDSSPQICGARRDIWSETLVGIDRKEVTK
jgi:hypothetical protein